MLKTTFRLTNHRKIILDYFKDNYNHPSIEEVFNFVKNKLPRISKKTVYSNLKFLCDKGLINEVKIKGIQRYEPKLEPHSHLICKKCGKIIDIKTDELLSHAMKIGKKIEDFYVESINVNFYGICKKCKEEDSNGRRK